MKKPKALNKPRCGMCEVDNIENWEEHEKTEEHQRNLRAFLGIVASGEYRKEEVKKKMESFSEANKEELNGILKSLKAIPHRTL
jgi:hypothetical protein